MLRAQRRLLIFLLTIPVAVVAMALLYQVGMAELEGTPRGFWQSLEWAAETITTTGYGADSTWSHPLMVLFVILVQLLGVVAIFLIFPVYLIPFLEERFELRLPRRAAEALRDHVLIYRYGPAVESLLDQLKFWRIPVLVLETDEGTARALAERKVPVVFARSEDEALEIGGLERAKTLVANGRDEENAGVILGARQSGFEGEIIALVEEPMHRRPLALAGATGVFTPRHVLAAALAARASRRISPSLSGSQRLGALEVREVRLHPESSLAGSTLGEAAIGSRTGATVVGQWVGGRLVTPPTADMRLEPRGILVVVGSTDSLERLDGLCAVTTALPRQGRFVVAGFGEVGSKVSQLLEDAGEEVFAIDLRDRPGVDLVGNVLDPEVLQRAELGTAQAVIVALDSDDLTLFASVVAQDLAPEVPVIARVNQAHNVEKIHQAGADFALSISQVAAQILCRRLVGEQSVALDPQVKVVRVGGEGLAGRHPSDLQIRERTEASVVAVERGDEVIIELGPDFLFAPEDLVYVTGSDEALNRYREEFGT